jgi:hypothetical protein
MHRPTDDPSVSTPHFAVLEIAIEEMKGMNL